MSCHAPNDSLAMMDAGFSNRRDNAPSNPRSIGRCGGELEQLLFVEPILCDKLYAFITLGEKIIVSSC